MPPLIECVPNFSEGRDMAVIKQITDQIETVEGVRLLDVDPGKATNRTVVTMVGAPEAVCEAAFRAVRKASEIIDMRKHKGEHPRFGATDVCPLIPVAGITMEETVEYAKKLGKRIGEELRIPIYLYEYAASKSERKNLANCRAGEYEGLAEKLKQPEWKPDFGPAAFNERAGATAVGARDFLVAYNVNLNTTSTRRANSIAFDIREKGRVKTVDGKPGSKAVVDEKGSKVWEPGTLKCVKAIGWFIDEFGVAQISINLTNLGVTPIHVAFDECVKKAAERGIRVTGSEIVGLVPLAAMLEAGRYFLRKQQRSTGVSDAELIKIAVKSLGLNDLYPFKPEEKIIEYAIADKGAKRLVDMTVAQFTDLTASEAPAPGGGSIAALCGSLGAALATMVANLSSHKRGWDDRWEEFSNYAEQGKKHWTRLLQLVDEDTAAFNAIMAAFGLPNGTDAEKQARKGAVQSATRGAIETPLAVMVESHESMRVIGKMAEIGMEASVSDAGVAALCALTAVRGAHLNVRINAGSLDDKAVAGKYLARAEEIEAQSMKTEQEILSVVRSRMKS
ncbi:MAG: glutamate formimidoyltransferase [Planctomycetia bacterium]|jgi:glutamate formiminotransferase/formiminotetrahydrofolate cyclodeaminase|nr:glutamate formimidoyltransferase [Planctomycetia bacterium]MCC7314249.1 glutamate formimidoyltransferase [Planctomycetota bacterium]OQZ00386.1 MAG: glutamate formimidoyltransferase [Planctomycetes bacterium UTPLA1]